MIYCYVYSILRALNHLMIISRILFYFSYFFLLGKKRLGLKEIILKSNLKILGYFS